MSKRLRTSNLHKCNRKSKAVDGISKLPDEIIVEILSLLTLTEAITTSILSRRWRYLWTLISKSLCFDSGKLLLDKAFNDKKFSRGLPDYKAKFVNWVNNVLNVHQGTVVDKFKVCMSLDATYTSAVNTWVEFAIKKRVQILDLTLTSLCYASPLRHPYVFPSFDKLNLPPDYTLICLKTLRLRAVDVSEHVIHHFLKQCPLLEQLSLAHSNTTLNLKIHGTDSLKLKHLDLYRCNGIENLEISAPNLISFSYTGPKKQVPFRNVPLLTELCIGDEYCESFISEAPKHLSYLSQLTKLTLILPSEVIVKRRYRKHFPKLDNLKQLELRVSVADHYPLIFLTYLIKAAPKLSKFVMKQLLFIGESKYYDGKEFCYEEFKGSGKKKFWHECLQEIEFVGFTGHPTDFQVAVRFLEISSVLEKMTIDTRHPGPMYWPDVLSDDFAKSRPRDGDGEIPKGTKEIAHKLRSYVPPGVQFEIILDDVFLP